MAKKQAQPTSVIPSSKGNEIIAESDIRRDHTRSDSYFSVYANDIQVQTGPWDVRMILGEIGDAVRENSVPVLKIKHLGEVRLSPQLAKRLTMILIQQLKHYEENIGTIPTVSE
jgi:hypothetical protein